MPTSTVGPIAQRFAAARAANALELEQGELRLVIVCAAGIFVFLSSQWDRLPVVLGCLFLGAAHLGWIVLGRGGNEPRRSAAMVLDIALVTAMMVLAEDAGAILFGLYVWIVTDNGARFGERYLRYSQALALAGFIAVVLLNPFWSHHLALAAALVLVLIAVPHYVSRLVGRLHAASRFSAAADHHLRQPLQALALYASVLEERLGDAGALRVLHDLQLSLRIVEQQFDLLLDLCSLESGITRPKVIAFPPLTPMLDQTVQAARALAARRNLELRLVPTALSVRGDPALLERMFEHLLTSAIRYGERGRIVVGCRRSGPRRLRLEIVGAAIPEISLVQRLGRLVDHAVTVRPAAVSIELERAG